MSYPRLRNAILDCIREQTVGTVSPSVRQIAKTVGSSIAPTYGALEQMRSDGLITWTRGRACSFEILREGPPREQIASWSTEELLRVNTITQALLDARLGARAEAAA